MTVSIEEKCDVQVAQPIGSFESLDASESGIVVVPHENVQNVDENEIKQAEDPSESQKFEEQIETESSAAPIDNQESQSVVEDSIESEFQNISSKDEIKLAETVNNEIPQATTMVIDIETHSVDSNVETLEEQENVALVSDTMENQKYETAPFACGDDKQVETLEEHENVTLVSDTTENQKYETAPFSCGDDKQVETLQEQENVALVSDTTENQKYETAPFSCGDDKQVETLEEQANVALVSDTTENQKYETAPFSCGDDKQVETVCEVPEETIEKNISVSYVEDIAQNDVNLVSSKLTQTENEIEPHSEIVVPVSFSPVDGPKSQIVESVTSDNGSHIRGMDTDNDASSKSNSVLLGMDVSAEAEHTLVNGNVHVESEVSNVNPEIVSNQPDSVDVKLESGSNLVLETAGVEEMGNQGDSPKANTDENVSLQENKDIENSQTDGDSGASKEDSSTSAIIEKETIIAAVTKPFNYLMRVPRFNDEGLKERIRQAKLQVEEKTKVRDTIQFQIQQIRANGQIHGVNYEYAKGEIRNARKLVRAKRVEIDSLHSVINKAKNAISIDDIDNRVYCMEHMMQHETLPLKEEKQFIREIKQLKSLRDELSSNMGSDEEIKQALEQRQEAEERLKILRKELEKLKGNVQKAESAAMEAGRKYEDENKKVKELQAQFRAANDVRQEAYAWWLSLRNELSEKNQYFFKYKDDTAAANNYAFRRDRESLYRLCTDQVEQLMELWNTNEDFRKEYTSFNVRSTVRRFGTLDGRALNPDEEPPILPSYVDERIYRAVSTPTNVVSESKSVVGLKSEATVANGTVNDKSTKKITENENQKVKSTKTAEPVLANGLPTAASSQAPDEVMDEPVKSREEIELDRKAEEMRKKEDEAKLKELRRLEGLAKANEARERKKRQAEKLKMRAELKARKEAEEKEKEREKRLRKKEKKATDSNDSNNNSDSAPSSESAIEIGREIDAKDMASVAAKKPQNIVKSNKKLSSIPAHIRNRNKKKWQNYAYVTMAGILVLILFWAGNVGLFLDKTPKKPNPSP